MAWCVDAPLWPEQGGSAKGMCRITTENRLCAEFGSNGNGFEVLMGRLFRYLLTLIFLGAVVGAVAVAFLPLPAPQEQIERTVEIEGLSEEIGRVQ